MDPREAILEQVERICSSGLFENAARSRTLLRFLAEEVVEGRADRLKEYTIGSEALGRGDAFDPRTDTIVRAEASRLRARLERYYASEGQGDLLVILLPKGGYVLEFREREAMAGVPPVGAEKARRKRFWVTAAVLAGIAVAVLLAEILVWNSSRNPTPSAGRSITVEMELRAAGLVASTVGTDVVISPNGARLAFIAQDKNGISRLHIYSLDTAETRQVPGTEGARVPFFSPDSLWVGFYSSGKLKKTPVENGSPLVVCDVPDLLGASWDTDGSIFASFGGHELWQIPASGGAPRSIIATHSPNRRMWPQVLRGKNAIVFTAAAEGGADQGTIELLSIDSGVVRVLARGGTFGRISPGGFLTYVRQGTLYAVRFDTDRLETSGDPQPIVDNIAYDSNFGYAQVDVSDNGTLVYRKSGSATMQWLEEGGRSLPIPAPAARYVWPSVSPDGRRLAIAKIEGGQSAVWLYDFDLGTMRLAATGLHFPLWSPDRNFLVLGGVRGLSWVYADQPSDLRPLLTEDKVDVPTSFRPDGGLLAFYCRNSESHFDLCTIAVASAGRTLQAGDRAVILGTSATETFPMISPNGRWIAYISNETGAYEVYVDTFPFSGEKLKISNGGGRVPRWSKIGARLFFRSPDQHIMVAILHENGKSLTVDTPRLWSPVPLFDTGVLANFDVGPNDRIIALIPATNPEDRQSVNHVTVVTNFVDHVRGRVAEHR